MGFAVEPDCGWLFSFNFPTPRRLRRPNHPNPFLLGFSPKLIPWSLSISSRLSAGVQGRQGAGGTPDPLSGQARQGRAGRDRF